MKLSRPFVLTGTLLSLTAHGLGGWSEAALMLVASVSLIPWRPGLMSETHEGKHV